VRIAVERAGSAKFGQRTMVFRQMLHKGNSNSPRRRLRHLERASGERRADCQLLMLAIRIRSFSPPL
jgi:hypothetical protein